MGPPCNFLGAPPFSPFDLSLGWLQPVAPRDTIRHVIALSLTYFSLCPRPRSEVAPRLSPGSTRPGTVRLLPAFTSPSGA